MVKKVQRIQSMINNGVDSRDENQIRGFINNNSNKNNSYIDDENDQNEQSLTKFPSAISSSLANNILLLTFSPQLSDAFYLIQRLVPLPKLIDNTLQLVLQSDKNDIESRISGILLITQILTLLTSEQLSDICERKFLSRVSQWVESDGGIQQIGRWEIEKQQKNERNNQLKQQLQKQKNKQQNEILNENEKSQSIEENETIIDNKQINNDLIKDEQQQQIIYQDQLIQSESSHKSQTSHRSQSNNQNPIQSPNQIQQQQQTQQEDKQQQETIIINPNNQSNVIDEIVIGGLGGVRSNKSGVVGQQQINSNETSQYNDISSQKQLRNNQNQPIKLDLNRKSTYSETEQRRLRIQSGQKLFYQNSSSQRPSSASSYQNSRRNNSQYPNSPINKQINSPQIQSKISRSTSSAYSTPMTEQQIKIAIQKGALINASEHSGEVLNTVEFRHKNVMQLRQLLKDQEIERQHQQSNLITRHIKQKKLQETLYSLRMLATVAAQGCIMCKGEFPNPFRMLLRRSGVTERIIERLNALYTLNGVDGRGRIQQNNEEQQIQDYEQQMRIEKIEDQQNQQQSYDEQNESAIGSSTINENKMLKGINPIMKYNQGNLNIFDDNEQDSVPLMSPMHTAMTFYCSCYILFICCGEEKQLEYERLRVKNQEENMNQGRFISVKDQNTLRSITNPQSAETSIQTELLQETSTQISNTILHSLNSLHNFGQSILNQNLNELIQQSNKNIDLNIDQQQRIEKDEQCDGVQDIKSKKKEQPIPPIFDIDSKVDTIPLTLLIQSASILQENDSRIKQKLYNLREILLLLSSGSLYQNTQSSSTLKYYSSNSSSYSSSASVSLHSIYALTRLANQFTNLKTLIQESRRSLINSLNCIINIFDSNNTLDVPSVSETSQLLIQPQQKLKQSLHKNRSVIISSMNIGSQQSTSSYSSSYLNPYSSQQNQSIQIYSDPFFYLDSQEQRKSISPSLSYSLILLNQLLLNFIPIKHLGNKIGWENIRSELSNASQSPSSSQSSASNNHQIQQTQSSSSQSSQTVPNFSPTMFIIQSGFPFDILLQRCQVIMYRIILIASKPPIDENLLAEQMRKKLKEQSQKLKQNKQNFEKSKKTIEKQKIPQQNNNIKQNKQNFNQQQILTQDSSTTVISFNSQTSQKQTTQFAPQIKIPSPSSAKQMILTEEYDPYALDSPNTTFSDQNIEHNHNEQQSSNNLSLPKTKHPLSKSAFHEHQSQSQSQSSSQPNQKLINQQNTQTTTNIPSPISSINSDLNNQSSKQQRRKLRDEQRIWEGAHLILRGVWAEISVNTSWKDEQTSHSINMMNETNMIELLAKSLIECITKFGIQQQNRKYDGIRSIGQTEQDYIIQYDQNKVELLTWYQATQIIICTLESAFVVLVKAWNVVCASRKLGRSIENEEQEDTSIYTQAVNVLTECGAIVSLQSLITEQQDNNEELEEGDQLSSAAKRLLNLCEQLEF